jgi:hypothetical protein
MKHKIYKPIHDGLHEFADILEEWSKKFRKLAEQLHTYDGEQRRVDEF